ncbi:hypothetical protein [Microbacterium sp. NPDC096154]|uniref:oxidoreductase n=1 Tax=Microbacterium sp. NPDC096154 TaxID=3155549 RepID=UPI0033263A5D
MPGVDVHTSLEPTTVAGVELRNRIMMSPMCQHRANGDGKPNDWHIVHYGARAVGRVGLIMLEDTAVTPDSRLGHGALGLYDDDQIAPFARVIDFCHAAGARVGVQINHAGRKSFLVDGAQADQPIVAPSAIPFNEDAAVPRAMEIDEIPTVVEAFVAAARRGVEAGADFVEIHGAHGYLLHEFLSPVANLRDDAYGGSLLNRARLLLEVVEAVRKAVDDVPISVRISATDLVPGGNELAEAEIVAGLLRQQQISLLDVSSGGLVAALIGAHSAEQPALAGALRRATGLPTVAVGGISTIEDADRVLGDGTADIVGVGRALLRNPFWVRELEGSSVGIRPEPGETYRGME